MERPLVDSEEDAEEARLTELYAHARFLKRVGDGLTELINRKKDDATDWLESYKIAVNQRVDINDETDSEESKILIDACSSSHSSQDVDELLKNSERG